MLAAPPLVLPSDQLQRLFSRLVSEWHRDTDMLSDSTRSVMHPAYQRIIGLGPQVVPLILREMRAHGGHWFWALRAITGEDPVTPEMAGKIRPMQQAWLTWASEKGYPSD
jgi:hypothetical protein